MQKRRVCTAAAQRSTLQGQQGRLAVLRYNSLEVQTKNGVLSSFGSSLATESHPHTPFLCNQLAGIKCRKGLHKAPLVTWQSASAEHRLPALHTE